MTILYYPIKSQQAKEVITDRKPAKLWVSFKLF